MTSLRPIQSADLYFTEGRSDKVYHAQLCAIGDGFCVNFQYGRRGSTLTAGTKTSSPVDLEKATKIFTKLVAEKMAKGYTPSASGVAFQGTKNAGRFSGLLPQLLNAIDESQVANYIADNAYAAQEKMDGERRGATVIGQSVSGINRKGLEVPLPLPIADALLSLGRDVTVDGEQIGDVLHLFDIRALDGSSVESLGYAARFDRLETLLGTLAPEHAGAVKLVPLAVTKEQKAALAMRMEALGREGFVFKLKTAAYVEGRPDTGGDQVKFKFYDPCQVEVDAINQGVRSVAIRVFDADDNYRPVALGNVTIPANASMPLPGDIIEVKYLYAYRNGSLFQPVYERARRDLDSRDCVLSQLKFKDEAPPATLRRRKFAA